jgi:hypothetical protein
LISFTVGAPFARLRKHAVLTLVGLLDTHEPRTVMSVWRTIPFSQDGGDIGDLGCAGECCHRFFRYPGTCLQRDSHGSHNEDAY